MYKKCNYLIARVSYKTQTQTVGGKICVKVSELQELCKLCDEKDADVRITTKKLAMVSLMTVFKDIIPG